MVCKRGQIRSFFHLDGQVAIVKHATVDACKCDMRVTLVTVGKSWMQTRAPDEIPTWWAVKAIPISKSSYSNHQNHQSAAQTPSPDQVKEARVTPIRIIFIFLCFFVSLGYRNAAF